MDFKEIAAVSGKSGLFRILKPTRNGVVLESLDVKKEKLIISSNTKVSVLKDVSMYTLSAEGNKPLFDIMKEIKNNYSSELPVSAKSDDKSLRNFFAKVVPDYDADRVYTSDIKKLVTWYAVIVVECPDVFEISEVEETKAEETAVDTKSASNDTSKSDSIEKPITKKATATKQSKVEVVVENTEAAPEVKAKKKKSS